MRTLLLLNVVCCCLFIAGCSMRDGPMTKSDALASIKKELKLKEVTLSEQPDGSLSGEGTKADGTKYMITVTLKKDQRSMSYTATSERGKLEAGSVWQFGPRWLQTAKSIRNLVVAVLLLFVVIGGTLVLLKRTTGKSKA